MVNCALKEHYATLNTSQTAIYAHAVKDTKEIMLLVEWPSITTKYGNRRTQN